jgi:Tfp pilus assembly protein PilN
MPLPFTSLIPKPKEGDRLTKILNILFYISLSLILLSLVFFFLLNNAVKKSAKFLENQEKTLISQRSPEQLDLEKNTLHFREKMKDFGTLFNQHRFTANVFRVLEEITLPKVWFSDFNLTSQPGIIVLTGLADSFNTLGEQLLVLKEDKNIKNLILSGAKINSQGRVEFNLQIILEPQVFSYQAPEIKEETK